MKSLNLVICFLLVQGLFVIPATAQVEFDPSLNPSTTPPIAVSREAFRFCSEVAKRSGSSGAECFGVIKAGGNFQDEALGTCSLLIPTGTYSAVGCLKEIENRVFQKSALKVCQDIIPNSSYETINCIKVAHSGVYQKETPGLCSNFINNSSPSVVSCMELTKGQSYQVEALAFCGLLSDLSVNSSLECLENIREKEFDLGALDVCKSLISSSVPQSLNCLKAIENASFSDEALLSCSSFVGRSSPVVVECLSLTRNLEFTSSRVSLFVRNISRNSTSATIQALRILKANHLSDDAVSFCGNLVYRSPQKAVDCLNKVVQLGGFSKEKSEACAQEIYDNRNVFQDWFNLVDIYSPCVLNN